MNGQGWLLPAIAAAVASVLASLFKQELYQLCRPLAEWVVARAARVLPPQDQDQYKSDWLAELDTVRGNINAVRKAVSIRIYAPLLRRALLSSSPPHPSVLACYSVAIAMAGVLIGLWWAINDGVETAGTIDGQFLLLCGLSVLHDCRTVPVLDRVAKIDQGSGALFDYALILGWAPGVSVPAIMVAGLLAHLIRHRHERPALGKALFNAGQFALTASVAVWTLKELGAAQPVGWEQPAAIVSGMMAYSMVNTTIMRIAVALDRSSANLRALWVGWPVDAAEWTILAGLASFTIFAVRSLLGIGLLLLLAFIYSKVMARMNDLVRPTIHLPQ